MQKLYLVDQWMQKVKNLQTARASHLMKEDHRKSFQKHPRSKHIYLIDSENVYQKFQRNL